MRSRALVFVGVAVMSACNPEPQTCMASEQWCEGVCTDFSSSAQHCGSCDHACENGERCVSGECVSRCTLPGGFVDAGVIEGCLVCEPIRSSNSLSPREDGVSCATGLCHAGQCEESCFIEGQFISNGAVNGSNPCERCDLGVSAISWAVNADGSACGSQGRCQSGVCSSGCFIGDVLQAPGTVNPLNACEKCTPSQSTTLWVPVATGEACGSGQICSSGLCTSECFIDQAIYVAGANNPANACEVCDPMSSTSAWAMRDAGASCGTGVCENDTCVDKCFIAGGFIDAGTASPDNLCFACVPATSTSDYSQLTLATLLTPGTDLAAQGWATYGVGSRSLTDDGGVITLATVSTGGTGGGANQLLSRRISPDGGAFTLRVELRVDAVNAHNTLDSAAAILGRYAYTPPPSVGTNIDRTQMVYLDANRVGWADDSQFATFGNIDGGFHIYELSVAADAGARFSVDGVQLLSRGNFQTNGIIAIGDQTNDPNVESTLSLRSVSLVCQ